MGEQVLACWLRMQEIIAERIWKEINKNYKSESAWNVYGNGILMVVTVEQRSIPDNEKGVFENVFLVDA